MYFIIFNLVFLIIKSWSGEAAASPDTPTTCQGRLLPPPTPPPPHLLTRLGLGGAGGIGDRVILYRSPKFASGFVTVRGALSPPGPPPSLGLCAAPSLRRTRKGAETGVCAEPSHRRVGFFGIVVCSTFLQGANFLFLPPHAPGYTFALSLRYGLSLRSPFGSGLHFARARFRPTRMLGGRNKKYG